MEMLPGVNVQEFATFRLHSGVNAVIPTKFENVKLVALLDADSAKAHLDPVTLHATVYPILPDAICPDDPFAYSYLKVQLQNGSYTAVGLPWIDKNSVEKRVSGSAVIEIENVSPNDLQRLVEHISGGGWSAVSAAMKK